MAPFHALNCLSHHHFTHGRAFCSASAQPADKKPFTFEDMMRFKRISGRLVPPDGKWVLFSW